MIWKNLTNYEFNIKTQPTKTQAEYPALQYDRVKTQDMDFVAASTFPYLYA